ncbi:MAG: DUF58 domain-containing protein [Pseudomonadota bacterium]
MPASARRTFPLVPRRRLVGIPFGEQRSARRGTGSDVAGSRPYEPGDPVSTIDWYASARLSAARGRDEFVVQTRFADEAPRVAVVVDRRPAMSLYAPALPWLSKPAAVGAAVRTIGASAAAARAELGYLDLADGRPYWLAPGSRAQSRLMERRAADATFGGPEDAVARSLEFLLHRSRDLPTGAFVFVVSDFLRPPPVGLWLRALKARWDPVPVVVQDPTWEASFPAVGGVTVPVLDPADGVVREVRLRQGEARGRRRAHEERRRRLLAGFARIGVDPVLVDGDEEHAVAHAFVRWAERRRRARRVR